MTPTHSPQRSKQQADVVKHDFNHFVDSSLWVSSPEFAGWLSKRTSNWLLSSSFFGSRSWAMKWVSLHGTELVYMDREPLVYNTTVQAAADNDESREAEYLNIRRGQINSATIISPDEEGHDCGFVLHFDIDHMPSWHFRAASVEEKANWMIKLSQAQAIIRWLEEYERVKILGVGAQGIVYELKHKTTGESLALKEMEIKNDRQMANAIAEAQFLKTIVQSVSHPNIMQIQKVFQVGSKFYLVFPLCRGGEIYDALVKRGHFTEFDAARIAKQLVSALHALHTHDILHLDIKPENILFESSDDQSKIMLTDFGLSKLFSDLKKTDAVSLSPFEDPQFAAMTYDELLESQFVMNVNSGDFGTHHLRGTLGYMSPELILCGDYSKAADVFAAGVVLYILLVGYPPFYSKSNRQTFVRTIRGLYKIEGNDWDEISPEAKDLVMRMLEKDPRKRITTAEVLQHDWIRSVDEPTTETAMAEEAIALVATAKIVDSTTTSSAVTTTETLSSTASSKPSAPSLVSPSLLSMSSNASTSAHLRQLSVNMRRHSLRNSISQLSSHVQLMQTSKIADRVTRIMSMAAEGLSAHHSKLAAKYLKTCLPSDLLAQLNEASMGVNRDTDGGADTPLSMSQKAHSNSHSRMGQQSSTSTSSAAASHIESDVNVDSLQQYLGGQSFFSLINKDSKMALANAVINKFGTNRKLSYEQLLQFRKYFGFQGFQQQQQPSLSVPSTDASRSHMSSANTSFYGNLNVNANTTASAVSISSSSNSGRDALLGDINSFVNLGDLLMIRMIDRDSDGLISLEDVLTLQILLMQKHEQILQAIFRIYVEAIWYPGKHINMLHAMQATANTSSSVADNNGNNSVGGGSSVNVIDPPKYITSKNVAAVFEKFGQSAEDGERIFDTLCKALLQLKCGHRVTSDTIDASAEGEEGESLASIPATIAEDELDDDENEEESSCRNVTDADFDGEELEKSLIRSSLAQSTPKHSAVAGSATTPVGSPPISSPLRGSLSKSPAAAVAEKESESLLDRLRKRSTAFKKLREQTLLFASSQSNRRRMDVNDFIRVSRIDDVLVQVLFRPTEDSLFSFVKYCERITQNEWILATRAGRAPPSISDLESIFRQQLDAWTDGFRPQSLPPLLE